MNFLLSWVHWTLALLLYLHHAKVSDRARLLSPGRSERLSRLGTCVRASARVGASCPTRVLGHRARGVPPLSSYVEGEGVRSRWEGARIVSPPTRALPTHQSHRTYDLGRAAEGGSQRRRPRGLGLRCGWRQKFAPGGGSPENWKSGQRGRETGAQRACLGVLGPWTGGGQRSWRGQGASDRGGFAVTAARVSSALAVSLGKVLGWIATGTLSHSSS
ncbi:hypothetical protein LEMLEM_LOCUS13395 [Lemmus lemmus]